MNRSRNRRKPIRKPIRRTEAKGVSRVSTSGNYGWTIRIYHEGETAGVMVSDGKFGGPRIAERAARECLAEVRRQIAEAEVPLGIGTVKKILREERDKRIPSFS